MLGKEGSPRVSINLINRQGKSREKKKEECSKGWETEERVYPHAQTATISTLIRSTPKRSQKVRTVEAGTGSQDQKSKNQVGRGMTCPNHGYVKRSEGSPEDLSDSRKNKTVGHANLVSHVQLYVDMKCNDLIELHNIKQRDGESTEDFVRRYKLKSGDVKGAPECMRIFGFVHGITNPKLIKRLHDKIPKTVDEMMRVTTSFLRGEVAASNHEREKSFPPWKQQEGNQKQNFRKGSFRNLQSPKRKQDRFTLLTKTPKENFALEKGKFKAPPPMTTPVEKWNHAKLCEFHGEVGHNTDESTTPLIGFSGEIIWPIGQIQLLVTISVQRNYRKTRSQKIISSSVNGSRNAEAPGGRRSNYPKKQQVGSAGMRVGLWTRRDPQAPKPIVEERVKVAINPEHPEQTVMIGSTLTEELCNLLQRNLDIFAWKPADITGVPRHIAKHRLNVREGCSPVRQKKRGQAADRNQALHEEVGKLVEARIMKEVHYHDWLSNPVMVKKHDDSWRMCVDFKDLNKACPKDGYPLPEIDWKVESLCGFPFKCFLDAYKGYHQIQMAKEDEEKTAFITSQGIFCYTKMPFGLRNVGAT
ncbi:hypothetical protein Tco_0209846 [Tanacetum coccineum]